jgi:hypothetical protein
LGSKLYAVGGYDGTHTLSTTEVYDPAINAWSTETPMPTPRAGLGAAVVNGILYAIGGNANPYADYATNEAFVPEIQFASFAAKAQIHLGGANNDGFAVEAQFRLGVGNNGINPLSETVTIGVGTGHWSIPAGSFKPNGHGGYVFQGYIGTTGLGVVIQPLRDGSFGFGAAGAHANLSGTANPVPITLTIGDDGGSTSVVATFY